MKLHRYVLKFHVFTQCKTEHNIKTTCHNETMEDFM